MKLAFVSTMAGFPWGGSEHLWSEAAKLAVLAEHSVFTSTYFWEDQPDAIKELAESGAISHFRPRYNPAIWVRFCNRLKRLLTKEPAEIKALKVFDPDRILLNQSGGYDILHRPELQHYLLNATKPYAIICHNYDEEWVLSEKERIILRQVYSKARQVFMICQPQANAIMKQLVCRLPNIKIVDNPVNLKKIDPIPMPPFGTVQFASVATFHVERKAQDIILEVLSGEKWKTRNWQLNFYGDGPHQEYIEELVAFFELKDKVVFHGHVKDINALWKENHILLLSSRVETGPMVLTEAMLCARPVVATRVGRVNDLIRDGYNGFVAGAATVALYDDALERAWQQKEQWPGMGCNAYTTAKELFDLNAAQTFLNLLTEN